jgi:HPt (histidine-containing phosphotransfer) domain-containing protein
MGSAQAIEHQRQLSANDSEDMTPLYVFSYCDFRNPESGNTAKNLGALLSHLCTQLGNIPDDILREHSARSKPGSYSAPTVPLLHDSLLQLAEKRSLTVFVDAIDESDDSQELADALRRLAKESNNISVFATSRNITEIEATLRNAARIALERHIAKVDSDIRRCIDRRMESDSELTWLKPDIRCIVSDALSSKSKGM